MSDVKQLRLSYFHPCLCINWIHKKQQTEKNIKAFSILDKMSEFGISKKNEIQKPKKKEEKFYVYLSKLLFVVFIFPHRLFTSE